MRMPGGAQRAAIRAEVETLARAERFTSAHRRSLLLRYLVEEELSGRREGIKEAVIAAEVFGIADYDTQSQSVVRGEMRRLRLALLEHYSVLGDTPPLTLSIPKGSYRPQFVVRQRPPVPALPASHRWMAVGVLAVVGLVFGLVRPPKPPAHASPPSPISVLLQQAHHNLDLRTPDSLLGAAMSLVILIGGVSPAKLPRPYR